jgi:hypothetical protein
VKILLDESAPKPLAQDLVSHECATVQGRGWSGLTNGELLRRATAKFDLFITCDQNIRYQQNLANQEIAILQLSTNDLRRIRAAISAIQSAVASIQRGEFKVLEIP